MVLKNGAFFRKADIDAAICVRGIGRAHLVRFREGDGVYQFEPEGIQRLVTVGVELEDDAFDQRAGAAIGRALERIGVDIAAFVAGEGFDPAWSGADRL